VEEFYGPKPSDLGLKRESFILTNDKTEQIALSGISDTTILLEVLAASASRFVFGKNGLLVSADTTIQNGEIALHFGNPHKDETLLNGLYSAHHTVWDERGVSRAWGGVRFETNKMENLAGDFYENLGNELYRVTRKLKGLRPNLIQHPNKIYFYVHDENNTIGTVTRVEKEEAIAVFGVLTKPSKYIGAIALEKQVERFAKLLNTSGASVYVINTADKNFADTLVWTDKDVATGKVLEEIKKLK
jgi:hypothetical protein